MIVSIGWLSRVIVSITIFVFAHSAAFADERAYSSSSLEEPYKIEFKLEKGDALLIKASQEFADVSLSLRDLEKDSVAAVVDFPFEKRLPEVLVVKDGDCSRCEVTIFGISKADMASPFNLTIKATEIEDIELLELLRNAGELHYSLTDENRENYLASIIRDLEAASNVANNRNKLEWRWHALTLLSEQLALLGDFEKQTKVLKTILNETEGKDSIYRIQALYEIGSVEESIGKENAGYEEGMHISNRLDKPMLWAMGANYKAISLVNEGKVSQAIALLEQAYRINAESGSWRSLWDPLHNLSWANLRQGNNLVALKYSKELELLARRFDDHENEMWALYNIARCYRENGLQGLAEQTFDSLESKISLFSESAGGSIGVLTAALFQEKGELLLDYRKTSEAADYIQSMREQEQNLGFKKRLSGVTYLEGKVALANGATEVGLKKIKQARDYDLKNERMRSYAAKGLYLSKLYSEQKNFLEASSYIIPSLKELAKTTDYKTITASLSSAIEVLNGLGGYIEAREVGQNSGKLVSRYADQLTQLEFSINVAKTAFYMKNWSRADQLLAEARQMVYKNLKRILRKDLRRQFLELNRELYELSISIKLTHLQENIKAFELAEEYKAIMLSDLINSMELSVRHQKGNQDELQVILNRLNHVSEDWFRTSNEEYLKEARKLSADLYKFETRLLDSKEEQLEKYLNLRPVAAPPEGQLRLSFFIGETKSWAWVQDSKRVEAFELPAHSELETIVSKVITLTQISPGLRDSQGAWEDNQLVESISELLLSPIESFISNVNTDASKYNTLLVVPDGMLQNFPFAMLHYGDASNSILDSFAIQITPSVYQKNSNRSVVNSSETDGFRAMLIANPNEFIQDKINLPRIDGVEKEVELIKRTLGHNLDVFNSFASVDKAASVLQEEQYSIIHFSTHALLNQRNPLLSGLVLPIEPNENRFLITPEIISNEFSAELIVLSGCNTSNSVLNVEGGLNSLSLAFLESGAKRVLGSQWKIDDHATATLMGYFYGNLVEKKMTSSRALSEAQLRLRKSHSDWKDPYFWAGFQLISAN